MHILSIECSATAASAAVIIDGKVIKEVISYEKRTHSETLLPLTEKLLLDLNLTLNNFNIFAACGGPGSFTGLRIGISLIKGFSFKNNTPCYCADTLEVIAFNERHQKGLILSLIDARQDRYYAALFCSNGQDITRKTENLVLTTQEILNLIKNQPVVVAGDGAELFLTTTQLKTAKKGHIQTAAALGLLCYKNQNKAQSPKGVMGNYIIKPKAEQERLKNINN